MKKLIISTIGTLFLCLGCGNKDSISQTVGVEFDSICVDTVAPLVNSTNSPKCEVSLHLLYAKGENADKMNYTILRSGILTPDYLSLSNEKLSVKQSVDSFVNKYISDYMKEYGALYRDDKEHGASYDCTYKVRTRVFSNMENTITYEASISTYGGGAHGIEQTIVKNYDVKKGKLLTLNDIFVPGYEEKLLEAIIKKMAEQFDVKDIEELKNKYIFSGGNPYITENMMIEDENITFIYCEDEIAPHALGEIRITIDKDDIEKILKNQ